MIDDPVTPDPLHAAADGLSRDGVVGLATVVRTWGSAPRQAGAQMCVGASGDLVGSVSGGCVEGAVVQTIQELLESGGHEVLSFGVSDEEAWEVGLACGGQVEVLAEVVREAPWLSEVLEARSRGDAVVIAVDLEDGARTLLRPLDGLSGHDGSGTVPTTGGSGIAPTTGGSGTAPTTGGYASPELLEAARLAVREDRSKTWETNGRTYLLQVFNPPVRVLIVGAVHIAQPLSAMVRQAGFDVAVIDPRHAFATEARFPGTELLRSWPGEALEEAGVDHRTAVVTVTHDPKLDDPALQAALRSPAFYVGALGSRRTHAKRVARLREAGFSEDEIGRIHAPVGLDIGARTPGEIAASVLAEIVGVLRAAMS
ncbi:MAG: XdhC/CoxI family protein [Longimicrobiales bacterium]|nr:XdhC/CoxI family protein [Longimicrobiales bacterium]